MLLMKTNTRTRDLPLLLPVLAAAINSLTPIVAAFGDSFFLKASLPRAPWPCVIMSFVGCAVIGVSQSHVVDMSAAGVFSSDDAMGCALQFLSMCFSAAARILMKRTEHILSQNEAVQTNNVSNFVFPLLHALLTNPEGWEAFRHIFVPQNSLSWLTIALLVYTIGSTGQMSLVRSMGPGMYSSLSAVRVLGSALLSAIWLKEPVRNWLEWLGLGIIVMTMTLCTVASVDTEPTKGTPQSHDSENEDHDGAPVHDRPSERLSLTPNEHKETIELMNRPATD